MAKKLNYLSNKEILPEIIKFKETGVASEKFGMICLKIAQRYINSSNYAGYTQEWKEDMVSEAVYTCLKYSKGFKPEKSDNPFAYLTQICKNSFKGYLNAQKKYKNIKDECYKKQNLVPNNPYIAIDYKDLKKWDTVTKEDEDK